MKPSSSSPSSSCSCAKILASTNRLLACILLLVVVASVVRTALLFSREDLIAKDLAGGDEYTIQGSRRERATASRRKTGGGKVERAGPSRSGKAKRGARSGSWRSSVTREGSKIGGVARNSRARKADASEVRGGSRQEDNERQRQRMRKAAPAVKDDTGAYVWLDTGIEKATESTSVVGEFGTVLDELIEDPVQEYIDVGEDDDHDDDDGLEYAYVFWEEGEDFGEEEEHDGLAIHAQETGVRDSETEQDRHVVSVDDDNMDLVASDADEEEHLLLSDGDEAGRNDVGENLQGGDLLQMNIQQVDQEQS